MSDERAGQKSEGSGDDVQKKIARGAIEFFEGGAELHQGHHVEADVNQSAVQEHRGDQPIPLMLNVNSVRRAHPETVSGLAAHSPQDAEATAFALGCRGHPLDSEHHQVGDQECGGYWRGAGENSGEAAIYGGHGKFKIGPAIVATRRVYSDQGAAVWTELGTRLLVATAAERILQRGLPAVEPILPLIGKRQLSSLRHSQSVPIIPKSPCPVRRTQPWINLKNLGNASMKN